MSSFAFNFMDYIDMGLKLNDHDKELFKNCVS